MKRYLKDKWLLTSLFITFLMLVFIGLNNDGVFMFRGDISDQLLRMYIQGWERVRAGSLPFWDWSNFLGANYFGSSTYYVIGSPFFWLACLLPYKEWIVPYFLVMNAVKSLLATFFTFIWIKKVTGNSKASMLSGVAYTFGAQFVYYYVWSQMLDVILLFPLALYFVECYLKDNKWICLSLSIGLIGIVNYYFLYLFTPFIFIYTLTRYIVLQDKINILDMLKKAGFFILIYLSGLLLCMVTLYPSYEVIKNNPRSSEISFSLKHVDKFILYRYITAFFCPVCNWMDEINYYILNEVHQGVSYGGGFVLYSFILCPFLLITSLFNKKDKEIISLYILYGVYTVFVIFPMFYILFNQNYETRWMINIVLINILSIGTIVSKSNTYSKKSFIISGFITILLLLSFYTITVKLGFNYYERALFELKRNILVQVICVVIYVLSINYSKKAFNILIVSALVIESILVNINMIKNRVYNIDMLTRDEIDNFGVFNTEVTDYIKDDDSDFYRIDIGTLKPMAVNEAISARYNSFNIYHSLYNYHQLDFMVGRFFEDGQLLINPQRGKWQLKNLLGSKYWFTYAGEEITYLDTRVDMNYKDYPPYGYEYFATVDGRDIYKNKYFFTFAYPMYKTINEETFKTLNTFDQDRLLNNHIILKDSSNVTYSYIDNLVKVKEFGEVNDFDLTDKEGCLYIKFINDNKFSHETFYTFYDIDGFVVEEGRRKEELGYYSVTIPDGAAYFDAGLPFDSFELYYDDLSWYDSFYNTLKEEMAYNVSYDDNSIRGDINLKQANYVVTSIPYDPGWTLKIDGVKYNYEKVNLGFIGFYLDKGIHHIELTYMPPGLILGLTVSGTTLALVIGVYIINKKKIVK